MTETPTLLADLLPSWQVSLNAANKSRHTTAQYGAGLHCCAV